MPILNPWVLLGIALALVASHTAVGIWQRKDGAQAVEAAWAKDKLDSAAKYKAKFDELNSKARAKEQEDESHLRDIGSEYALTKMELERRNRLDRAAARDGSLRLFIPASCGSASGSPSSSAPAPSPGGSDTSRTELPPKIASDLLDLANDADGVVDQLTACQKSLRVYL